MYRGVFTVGVVVTNNDLTLTDVSTYVIANGATFLARCLTGLGPNGTSNGVNGDLGGLYFNGNMIRNSGEQAGCGGSTGIQVRPGSTTAGVINFHQCGSLNTDNEGVYTCTMMNSAMMSQSVRFGIYLNGRSELLDFYVSHHLTIFHFSTQLLQ